MSLYSVLAVVHVIAAVGGVGQLSAVGLMSRMPDHSNPVIIKQILRAVGWSLVLILITGIGMLWVSDWVYERTWWLRIGFLLFVFLGALHGVAQGTVKKIIASESSFAGSPLIPKLRGVAITMSLLLVVIVLLMEGKPF